MKFTQILVSFILPAFICTTVCPPQSASAQSSALHLPPAGAIGVSQVYSPALIKGLSIDRNDPFKFEFLMDTGDSDLEGDELQDEIRKMLRYFMASLAVPEDEMWVNLSPYEKGRIIPEIFGRTEMGRDLLAQDYILKQLTASLMSPENEAGRKMWEKVYEKIYNQESGNTDSLLRTPEQTGAVPVSQGTVPFENIIESFNKVWIVPETGYFYEHDNSVFIVDAKLKIMLESDYLAEATSNGQRVAGTRTQQTGAVPVSQGTVPLDIKQIIRSEILPIIEDEINNGENFANLRQIYNAMLLSLWFKRRLKDHVLGQVYADQRQVLAISLQPAADGKSDIEKIWEQYVETFKSGALQVIQEEYDPVTQSIIPRKYFTGGAVSFSSNNFAMLDPGRIMSFMNAWIAPLRVLISFGKPIFGKKLSLAVAALLLISFTLQAQDSPQYPIFPLEILNGLPVPPYFREPNKNEVEDYYDGKLGLEFRQRELYKEFVLKIRPAFYRKLDELRLQYPKLPDIYIAIESIRVEYDNGEFVFFSIDNYRVWIPFPLEVEDPGEWFERFIRKAVSDAFDDNAMLDDADEVAEFMKKFPDTRWKNSGFKADDIARLNSEQLSSWANAIRKDSISRGTYDSVLSALYADKRAAMNRAGSKSGRQYRRQGSDVRSGYNWGSGDKQLNAASGDKDKIRRLTIDLSKKKIIEISEKNVKTYQNQYGLSDEVIKTYMKRELEERFNKVTKYLRRSQAGLSFYHIASKFGVFEAEVEEVAARLKKTPKVKGFAPEEVEEMRQVAEKNREDKYKAAKEKRQKTIEVRQEELAKNRLIKKPRTALEKFWRWLTDDPDTNFAMMVILGNVLLFFKNHQLEAPGGVDLSAEGADIRFESSDNGFVFPKVNPAMLQKISPADMAPLIIDVAPMPKSEIIFRLGLAAPLDDKNGADIVVPAEKAREPEEVVWN